MSDRLRIAVTAGEMYDGLYKRLPDFEQATGVAVEIVYRRSHPQLNTHLASLPEVPYELVSTHTKYAPSQLSFLAPLDEISDGLEVAQFYPSLIDLASVDSRLYGIPRNIDTKLLHFRTDVVRQPPTSWDDLVAIARHLSAGDFYGFVFPGMESGLFGLFYELAEMAGASLFPVSNQPALNNEGGRWALGKIRELYQSRAVPPEITSWHYDEAHRCFRDGNAAMICDWPGYYAAYRDQEHSRVSDRLAVVRMPAGPTGVRKAYSGAHTFALTRKGVKDPAAIALLRFLTSYEQQLFEARHGFVPPRPAVLKQVRNEAEAPAAERWNLLDTVIADEMLIPPKFSYYPEIEEILWRTVQNAMTGSVTVESALDQMERRITQCHRDHARAN